MQNAPGIPLSPKWSLHGKEKSVPARRSVSKAKMQQLAEWAKTHDYTMMVDWAPEAMMIDEEGKLALVLVGREREREHFKAKLDAATALARLGVPVYVWNPPNRIEKVTIEEETGLELK